jgi:signal peptidase I
MNLSQYNMKLKKSWLKSELPQILLIIALVLAARSSLADHYYVPSGSMEYTLMPGDRVLVSKMAYGLRVPFTTIEFGSGAAVERGDVVIFDSPKDGVRLIKRIVGIGGDTVSISDGHLIINGAALATVAGDVERFGARLAVLNLQDGGGPDIQGAVIPPHMLLAIGDHRGSSLDGRYFGLVGENDVYGKALGVYRRRGEGFIWNPL